MDTRKINVWLSDLDEVCNRMEWLLNALDAIRTAMAQPDAGAETFLPGLFGTWMQLDEQRQQLRALYNDACRIKREAMP